MTGNKFLPTIYDEPRAEVPTTRRDDPAHSLNNDPSRLSRLRTVIDLCPVVCAITRYPSSYTAN
jgi:hypothetical protein